MQIFSDLPGRFTVRAKDGSEYLLHSVYKNYIHVLHCLLGHSPLLKVQNLGQRNFSVSLYLLRYPAHRLLVPTGSP
jgi:hypothetical protein